MGPTILLARPVVTGTVRLLVAGVAPWASAGRKAARYLPGTRGWLLLAGADRWTRVAGH
ncbi:hypothetical protein AB0M43_04960 [Longispora sp. NPDC051575]|uniref:hypothetical protein n=1 Tax=Longispora sp. NPDC051575 TaxID=3154943 RepID=UPI00342FF11C